MPLSALVLVMVAACLHATWNLWLKKAQAPGVAFIWCSSTAAFLAYAPIVLWLYGQDIGQLNHAQWLAVLASGALHVAYFFCLQRGYAAADLSIVYPVARGVGPLLAALAAMLWLDEPPSLLSLSGLALIVSGTFTIAGGWALVRGGWSARVRHGLGWGALTGMFIAAYTVNDGRAVKLLAVAPLLLDWLANGLRGLALIPVTPARLRQTRDTIGHAWPYIAGVALVSPLAYILVLEAMKMAPVSHVAPARELSMLIAAFLGAHLLNEGDFRRRIAGAALIAGGVICLAAAG